MAGLHAGRTVSSRANCVGGVGQVGAIGLPARSRRIGRTKAAAWALWNSVQLAFTLAWTAGWISLASLVRMLTGGRHWPLRMASRCWAPGLLGGAGARLRIEGVERVDWSRPCVLVANHQSIIDACALFRAVPAPLRFVLKQEMAKVPFVGWYARAMGMVFIERGAARSAPQRLRDAVALVRGGAVLCAFPEGTRSRDGSVGPFKGGVLQVAIEAGVPVVPVALQGSGAVLPAAGFRVRPGAIAVRFGEPIATTGLASEDRNTLARRAREAVVELLHPQR
ncbi:MAG: 1-acyl-sn-glycerol-3-phosphate acyltransferase [Lysobacter sp.]|nr:1-acyl-sn-glycerol-3-phosphate acyltransferase [Lysobacter sp.]